ncbi:MAG: creatininase family protein [Lentisphaeria bacterium]|nr:creatininase family protein [Lentisphaeria bacterium]
MARNMHKFEELTPYEFDQEKKRASIIYVAAGPVEYHEECNALGIDPCKGYAWCLAAAEITGGIVFPMVPFAPSGGRPFCDRERMQKSMRGPHFSSEYTREPLLYPGVFSCREVCYPLYMELLETFAIEHQFKLCVFFGSHGPAGQMIKDIVNEHTTGDHSSYKGGYQKIAGDFHGMTVMAVGSLDYNMDIVKEEYAKLKIGRINHGGMWEAAINYAINPEYFQPERLDETKYPQHYGALAEEHYEGCVRPVKSEFRKLTPEFAKRIFDTTTERFAADVLENYKKVLEKEKA